MPTLDELVRAVRATVAPLPVRVAWVFGSHAKGKARAESDLDVAVAYDRGLDARAREDARRSIVTGLADALGAVGERADVCDVDETSTSLAFRALQEGVLAYARSDRERVEVAVRIMRRYDDAAPFRKRNEEAAVRAMRGGDGRS